MMRICAVCNKEVPQGYESDHLRANHLGPHYFWFDAKKYLTEKPSMTVIELKRFTDASVFYALYQETPSGDVSLGDDMSVDLTREPHFYCLPPATF